MCGRVTRAARGYNKEIRLYEVETGREGKETCVKCVLSFCCLESLLVMEVCMRENTTKATGERRKVTNGGGRNGDT